MKRLSAVAGVVAAILCTACGNQPSPVNPSAVSPSVQALGADALPFRGSFEGTQTVTPLTPPFASVEVSVTGTGAHLGRFTMTLPHTVNFATRSATGTGTIVAANGDTIVAAFTGQAEVGAVVSIVEHATITSGTGRFAGATGSFTIERVFDGAAGTTSGSFAGTISAPGAGQ